MSCVPGDTRTTIVGRDGVVHRCAKPFTPIRSLELPGRDILSDCGLWLYEQPDKENAVVTCLECLANYLLEPP